MKNSELLTIPTTNKLLSVTDQQKRFMLKEMSYKLACPNCNTPQNLFEASGVAIDNWDFNKTRMIEKEDPIRKCFVKSQSDQEELVIGGSNAYEFHCINCKRQLVEQIPLVRVSNPGWHWSIVPIEVEATR